MCKPMTKQCIVSQLENELGDVNKSLSQKASSQRGLRFRCHSQPRVQLMNWLASTILGLSKLRPGLSDQSALAKQNVPRHQIIIMTAVVKAQIFDIARDNICPVFN
jgi:hypothetical protein